MARTRAFILLALLLAMPATVSTANVITDWDEKAVDIVQPGMAFPPPTVFRTIAILHVAMFDAVNSIERRYKPYKVQLSASPDTSKEAAAAAAAAAVLVKLVPDAASDVQSALTNYLATLPEGQAKAEGIKLGQEVAARILEARADDGASTADSYRPRTRPGVYVPTAITAGSQFPNVTPFALTSPSQFRPKPPPSLKSEQWARDYNEIKDLGERYSTKRTARQNRGRALLAARRSSFDAAAASPGSHREEYERARQRALYGARLGSHDGRNNRRLRRQVQIRILASDHRDPQRRHRRQPGHRARGDVAADRCDPNASGVPLRALHPQLRRRSSR